MTITFTYDANGLVDDFGGNAHAWSELGVRSLSSRSDDFNPDWRYTYWEKTVDLIAGQHFDVGDVIVWGDGVNLYVKYATTELGCSLIETHLAIADSIAGIPQTKKGNPIPGQFPYSMVHEPPVSEYTYTIDATQWASTTQLFIAAHAVTSCPDLGEETAWAAGYPFPGKNWATYFTYQYQPIEEAGSGVWLATDYDWTANTFNPDPPGAPRLDLDDK